MADTLITCVIVLTVLVLTALLNGLQCIMIEQLAKPEELWRQDRTDMQVVQEELILSKSLLLKDQAYWEELQATRQEQKQKQ